MSQNTETQDGKGVADTDISPHDQTDLLKRIRSGELKIPLQMMGLRIYSPPSSGQSSNQRENTGDLQKSPREISAQELHQIAQEKEREEAAAFLSLGERIHWLKCPKNPFSSHDDLGKLAILLGKLSSADIDAIWKAIWYLEPNDKTVLTLEFQFDLPSKGLLQFVNNYSPETFLKVLARLKSNLRALLAYGKQQGQGDDASLSQEAKERNQTNFVLRGKPFTNCFKLVGLPKSQDKSSHLIKWEKTNLLPAHCNNGYFAKAVFQHSTPRVLSPKILKRIVQGSAIPLPKETLPSFYLVGNPYVSFSPEYFRLVGQPTTPATSEVHYPRIIPPFPAIRYEFNLLEGGVIMSTLLGITALLSYSSVLKLREKNVHTTADLLRTSSRQFKNFKFDPRTVRAIVEKMLHARYFFSDGLTATEEVLSQPAPGERKKLKGITALLQNQSLVNKLRVKGIRETEQLVKLTSAQLIDLFPVNEGNNFLSVRAIAKKLDKHGLHLADKDGPKVTRHLFDYHPATYRPLLETPEPGAAPPPDSAAADPGSSFAAATDPPADDPDPASFEALFRKIGVVLDKDNEVQTGISGRLTYHRTIKVHGKEYRITVTEQNLSSAG
jgi:hypothetical protein